MPLYRYQAVAASGDMVTGEIEAATPDVPISPAAGRCCNGLGRVVPRQKPPPAISR
jgi:hypothetical protein